MWSGQSSNAFVGSSWQRFIRSIDIKEGMEYAGGIKNTKVAVVVIVPGEGTHLLTEENCISS